MGMTNRDWLFSLPLEEQIAWMESEHSEPNPDCSAMLYRMFTENMKHEPCSHYEPKDDVSGYGADFNVAEPNLDNVKAVEMDASRLVHHEPDSREKLEVDAERYIEHAADYAYEDTLWADETFTLYDAIIELLDRQAAITERETTKRHELFCETCEAESDKQIAELTSERDKLKELNGYHAVQYELASEDCDRLQAQVDELTAERDNLKANNQQLHTLAGEQAAMIDELQKQVDELTNAGRKMSTELANMQDYITKVRAGRERYRSMCSEMATKIHDALMVMDEGMA